MKQSQSRRIAVLGLTAVGATLSGVRAVDDPTRNPAGTFYSTCSADAPMVEFRDTKDYGYLGEDAVCVAAGTTLPDGYRTCASGVYNAFTTDTTYYYACAQSRVAGCPGGCPPGSSCIQTTTASGDSFYLCGLLCAGDFYLCSDDAAKQLGGYTAYCDGAADQCGVCSSFDALSADGSTCSDEIYDVSSGPYTTAYLDKRVQARANRQQERDIANSPDCPVGLTRCAVKDGLVQDYECLDISEELEACGGCPDSGGIDCSLMEGADSFSTTCTAGLCVAHGCNEGYKLNGTICEHDVLAEGIEIDHTASNAWRAILANAAILKNVAKVYRREASYKIEHLWQLGRKPFWQVQVLG